MEARIAVAATTGDFGVARSHLDDAGVPSRLSHNLIAPQGRRLSTGAPWLVFAIVAAVITLWFLSRVMGG